MNVRAQPPLSRQQRALLSFLVRQRLSAASPPSIREMALVLDRSLSTTYQHLQGLIGRGYVTQKQPSASRTWAVTPEGEQAEREATP